MISGVMTCGAKSSVLPRAVQGPRGAGVGRLPPAASKRPGMSSAMRWRTGADPRRLRGGKGTEESGGEGMCTGSAGPHGAGAALGLHPRAFSKVFESFVLLQAVRLPGYSRGLEAGGGKPPFSADIQKSWLPGLVGAAAAGTRHQRAATTHGDPHAPGRAAGGPPRPVRERGAFCRAFHHST
jgi:hypothetical protein